MVLKLCGYPGLTFETSEPPSRRSETTQTMEGVGWGGGGGGGGGGGVVDTCQLTCTSISSVKYAVTVAIWPNKGTPSRLAFGP